MGCGKSRIHPLGVKQQHHNDPNADGHRTPVGVHNKQIKGSKGLNKHKCDASEQNKPNVNTRVQNVEKIKNRVKSCEKDNSTVQNHEQEDKRVKSHEKADARVQNHEQEDKCVHKHEKEDERVQNHKKEDARVNNHETEDASVPHYQKEDSTVQEDFKTCMKKELNEIGRVYKEPLGDGQVSDNTMELSEYQETTTVKNEMDNVIKAPAALKRQKKDNTPNSLQRGVTPTKRKKIDAVPPTTSFKAIDEHALKTPANVRTSIPKLVEYLVKPARNDMDRLRAFYIWITDNISYDTESFFRGVYPPQDSVSVLESGTSVCDGYASILESLCGECGIQCKKITGFSKGYSYDPEKPLTNNSRASHAWNIVYINGEWRPIETTWGAGHLESGQFVKCFSENYFLTDPEDFIYEHFPYMDKSMENSLPFQLLANPLSLEAFSAALVPGTFGKLWGFKCLSHETGVIDFKQEIEIVFTTLNVAMKSCMCTLSQKNSSRELPEHVLLRKQSQFYTLKVIPAKTGTYNLKIFGQAVNTKGSKHQNIINFTLRCTSVFKIVIPYPVIQNQWGWIHEAETYGFTKDSLNIDVLTTNSGEVQIVINTKNKPKITLGLAYSETQRPDWDRYTFKCYQGSSLIVRARLPVLGFYKLTLYAKDPQNNSSNSLDSVADFLIDNQKTCPNLKPYPFSYSFADECDCQLVEPLSGDLPSNQNIRLKLTSTKLIRIMINQEVTTNHDGRFDVTFTTGEAGEQLSVYGSSQDEGSSLGGLYKFEIV